MLSREERRKRKEREGRTARGLILHNKQTNTHHIDKVYIYIGLTIQARAGIRTMVGDYIHVNGRKINGGY